MTSIRAPASILFFALIGGVLFAVLTQDDEFGLLGAAMGAALGYMLRLSSHIRTLERRIQDLDVRLESRLSLQLRATASPPVVTPKTRPWQSTAVSPTENDSQDQLILENTAPNRTPQKEAPSPSLQVDPCLSDGAQDAASGTGLGMAWINTAWTRVRCVIARGNPVVQVGVVVLFFGVAFLVKYAAERGLVPIEVRLAGVGLGGLAMLIVGWRLRAGSGVYATVLQGGGVGVLYLTVYAAAKLFGLLPSGIALAIMVALVALSGALAVLQNAMPLALFGTIGGFLAPALASTGGGDHVMLFAYYALLNAGVLGISWFRAWRLLNLTGFVFTFVIGSLWGYHYYRPEHFATTEPFLLLFFLFYVAIAVLFAERQPLALRGYVDGGLVFGTPLVGFALQTALVRDIDFGLALSALALGGFYMLLATLLWRRGPSHMRLLTEAFLALGIVFASLAIPLALDGRWTATAWAMEGAAMVWIGVRQGRWLARGFGVLLQLGAGLSFLMDSEGAVRSLPVMNSVYFGSVIVALAGLFSAWYLQRRRDQLHSWENLIEPPLMIWGLLWWLGSGLNEIDRFLSGRTGWDVSLAFIALSALATTWLSQRLFWPRLAWPPVGLVALLGLTAVGQFADVSVAHPLGGWGLAAWPLALAASFRVLWRLESVWPNWVVHHWHPVLLWLLLFLLSWELDWLVQQGVEGAATWRLVAWALIPGLVVAFLWRFGTRIAWPVRPHFSTYAVIGLAPVAGYLFAWCLAASLVRGSAHPLPYVPLINPLDLAQAFALIALARWCLWLSTAQERPFWWPAGYVWKATLAAGAFVWMNTVLARTVHFWGGVPYALDGLHYSLAFQTSVAILWTLTAFALMLSSRLRVGRALWFTGAGLLAAVVVKLFLVDLVGVATVARIVSFLVVGVLMLVIGYFAPLPPRSPRTEGTP